MSKKNTDNKKKMNSYIKFSPLDQTDRLPGHACKPSKLRLVNPDPRSVLFYPVFQRQIIRFFMHCRRVV